MQYYFELRINKDPDFPATIVMNKLISRLHTALVQLGSEKIGISFPDYDKTLGERLRAHGDKDELTQLMACGWLAGLLDYLQINPIKEIPPKVSYCTFYRRQSKTSVRRLLARFVRKGWLTEQEAIAKLSGMKNKYLKEPYVRLESRSTGGHRYCLHICRSDEEESPCEGVFNSFGLSKTATVPLF